MALEGTLKWDTRLKQAQEAVCTVLQVSLSALDRRIATLFVFWDVFNVFLGGMFAGSAFSQLGVIINKPGSIPSVIGTALPASSNFFINTLILKVSLVCICPCVSFMPLITSLAQGQPRWSLLDVICPED